MKLPWLQRRFSSDHCTGATATSFFADVDISKVLATFYAGGDTELGPASVTSRIKRQNPGQGLGSSWRYIAGELYRGSHRGRGPQGAGAGEQLAVYSRGALQRRGGRGGTKEGGRENSRNLTTPHRRDGEQLKFVLESADPTGVNRL